MTKHIWYLKSFLFFTILLSIFIFFSTIKAEEIHIDYNKIAYIESRGNPRAYNKVSGGRGIMQITPIALKEYNNFHKIKYTLEDLFNPEINKKIAIWTFEIRLPQQLIAYGEEVNLDNLLRGYNAGARTVKDNILPKETRKYISDYKKLKSFDY